jgi:hypothetical protein
VAVGGYLEKTVLSGESDASGVCDCEDGERGARAQRRAPTAISVSVTRARCCACLYIYYQLWHDRDTL